MTGSRGFCPERISPKKRFAQTYTYLISKYRNIILKTCKSFFFSICKSIFVICHAQIICLQKICNEKFHAQVFSTAFNLRETHYVAMTSSLNNPLLFCLGKLAMQFIKDKNINYWPTPAESPDMNPVENLWHKLKHFLRTFVKPSNKEELVAGYQKSASATSGI